ncbi:hypothetical protein HK096_003735 [Nowakowskiella sp. JEL0078]|nr:hypothetical protein HK096_003735 [Nowakowskiella sp. JEL0078]
MGYAQFLNLLTPHDEYAYDLLPWALEHFTYSTIPAAIVPTNAKSKKPTIKDCPGLADFMRSLTNHFRATPPLIRYGACVCLHMALSIYPGVIVDFHQLSIFIVSGSLDTDYLSAFLYISMLEVLKPETLDKSQLSIKELISKYRRRDDDLFDYDVAYVRNQDWSFKGIQIGDILDVAVKQCPPLATKILHKMADSMEYIVGKSMKLKQLELIRVWCSKLEKFDTFLMKILIPLLNSTDEDIQLATIKVLHALIPGFETASIADISFSWTYLQTMMSPKLKSSLLKSILKLIAKFPLHRLSDESREQLLSSLFQLMFHGDSNIREMVYKLLGESGDFWKESSLFTASLGILFFGLGDQTISCLVIELIVKMIIDIQIGAFLLEYLETLKSSLNKPYFFTIKAYDDLAFAIAKEKLGGLQDLVAAIALEENVDLFWEFFLSDVPENQLVRPDEYNYTRNFIHSPFWISLLLTKLNVHPPPLTNGELTPREVMPTTPAGKRRFICGFMLAACLTMIYCCLRGNQIHPGILRGCLEYLSQQMIVHKQWTFQLSALDILKYLVRLKLPGISTAILLQYLDLVLDCAFNTPSAIVKIGSLELLEVLILVFPQGVSQKLSEARDIVRSLLVDQDTDVAKIARRIYPMIFRCVSQNNASEFFEYLRNEINLLQKGGIETVGDPFTAKLSKQEQECVLCHNIVAMGAILHHQYANSIVHELLQFVRSSNANTRLAVVTAILTQIQLLDSLQASTIIWVILPLYADPNKKVRLAFIRYLKQQSPSIESLGKALPPHPDDSVILPIVNWEEFLIDNPNITCNSKNLADIISSVEDLVNNSDYHKMPSEDDGLNLPTISSKLLARFKQLISTMTGVLPVERTNQGAVILVLSEFCCLHENTLNEIIEILHACLESETYLISTPVTPNEGDLLALFYLSYEITEVFANKAIEFLRKYIPIIVSNRHTVKKRLYAIFLLVELSLGAGIEEMGKVCDAIQIFLENISQEDIKTQVFGSLAKLVGHIGPKHSLFRILLQNTKRDIQSKDPQIRIGSLTSFRMFVKYLLPEELMWFCYLYLADTDFDVRQNAKEILVCEGVFEFVMPALKSTKSLSGTRRVIDLVPKLRKFSKELPGCTFGVMQITFIK